MNKAFFTVLFLSLMASFIAPTVNAGLVESMLGGSGVFEKYGNVISMIPKALPLLNGKVKSEECRKQGKLVAERAGDFNSAPKSLEETKDALQYICALEKKCFAEYLDAMRPLLETNLAKPLLQGVSTSQIKMFAGPAYDWMCPAKEKEEL